MKKSFRDALAANEPVLFDGAMGTQLYDKGVFINQSFDYVNLTHPDYVRQIHQGFIEAGSDVLSTNTFGGNRVRLKKFGLENQLEKINAAGVRLAREIASDSAWVAGAMGPLGIKIEPYGATSFAEAREIFREQAAVLHQAGVDLFVLETFSRTAELREAAMGIREVSDKPIVGMLTVNDFGQTIYGSEPTYLIPELEAMPLDVIGLNCSVGPRIIYDVLEQISKFTSKPLCAQPNAGNPKSVDGRNIYLCTPEYMATYVKRMLRIGVKVVGGCCGTTPDHIRAMARAIGQDSANPVKKAQPVVSRFDKEDDHIQVVPFAEKSSWARKIGRGEFVFTVEVVPPKGCDPTKTLNRIKKLKDAEVDAVNIPDGPRASSRMSPQVLALLIENRIGIETILHYCCRDRNILGIQSDLLGDFAGGLKNILAVTGDPPKLGDYPDATAVFDVDSIGLTNIINGLNHGRDIGKNKLAKPTAYAIGVALNPTALNIEEEINRFRWKVDAGAEFAITQPVFDADQFLRFYEKVERFGIPIVAGVWPLVSYKNAEFMNNEVPGVEIPQSVLDRMAAATDSDHARETGLEIAVENVGRILDCIVGAQISAPMGNVKFAIRVVDQIRELIAARAAVMAARES